MGKALPSRYRAPTAPGPDHSQCLARYRRGSIGVNVLRILIHIFGGCSVAPAANPEPGEAQPARSAPTGAFRSARNRRYVPLTYSDQVIPRSGAVNRSSGPRTSRGTPAASEPVQQLAVTGPVAAIR